MSFLLATLCMGCIEQGHMHQLEQLEAQLDTAPDAVRLTLDSIPFASLGLAEETRCTLARFVPLPKVQVCSQYLYASTTAGLYRCTLDEAGNWSRVPMTDQFVTDFAVRDDTLLAVTMSHLYISYDGGNEVHTVAISSIFPDIEDWADLDGRGPGIGVNPHNAKHLYIAHSSRVAYTGDGAATWQRLGQGVAARDLSYNPLDTLQIVGYENKSMYYTSSICVSLDGGNTWQSGINPSQNPIFGIRFHPTDKNSIIACGGIYLATDNPGSS